MIVKRGAPQGKRHKATGNGQKARGNRQQAGVGFGGIELFVVRPAFNRPGEFAAGESIAKIKPIPRPETDSLTQAVGVIDEDGNACFFG